MTLVSYEQELARTGKVAFTVSGVSMRPLLHAREDMILVKKCAPESLKNLDIVLHTRPSPQGKQYVLHRIVGRQSDGRFIIAGDNCVSVDIVPPEDILGVVLSAQRGNKPIRLEGLRYALYERLWCAPYKLRFAVLRCRNLACGIWHKIASLLRK